MEKPLRQITFDFATTVEEEISSETSLTTVVKPANTPLVEKSARVIKKDKPVSTRGRKSLKEIASNADLVQVPEDEVLFKKQYYSIGETAAMFNENQSLIRYWETEFDILKPRKNRKGDRFFRPVDIKNLVLIYDLLRRRKFTIEGAKEYLKKDKKADEKFAMIQSLEKIKAFFLELKANL
jgi:DNA-binding transcriptional MerR regulator